MSRSSPCSSKASTLANRSPGLSLGQPLAVLASEGKMRREPRRSSRSSLAAGGIQGQGGLYELLPQTPNKDEQTSKAHNLLLITERRRLAVLLITALVTAREGSLFHPQDITLQRSYGEHTQQGRSVDTTQALFPRHRSSCYPIHRATF